MEGREEGISEAMESAREEEAREASSRESRWDWTLA